MGDRVFALVLGSAGGIGGAVVDRLTSDGCTVIGADRPDRDLLTTAGIQELVDDVVIQNGTLDVVVHAIGMSGRRLGDGPVTECSDQAWDEVLQVNLGSAFRALRACLPHMTPQRGSIVLTSSVLADTNDDDFLTAAYAVSKSGLNTLARAAAFEGTRRGVRVNVVAPALVDTPMARRAITSEAIGGRMASLQPLHGRAATADEVAAAIAWLASTDSAMTTGHVLTVDGGWRLR